MSLEADQTLARQFFAALDANRLDALDDLIAPGYRFHAPGSPVLTWEQHKQFHTALSAGLARL
ncbi:MAG: nuclear transport factor 2 family protein, partial [Chloroflexi bacterium]|nr:nuclear transport factor 2 family protein [Chloroflexota bacterium]